MFLVYLFRDKKPRQLTEAIQEGDTEKVKDLIREQKIDINALHDGGTLLHHAVYNGKEDLVKELLRMKADITKLTEFGYDMQDFRFEFDLVNSTAKRIAEYKKYTEIAELLDESQNSRNRSQKIKRLSDSKKDPFNSSLVVWNKGDAINWLCKLGADFEQYQNIFKDNGVDGSYLNILTEDDIIEMMSNAKSHHTKRLWQKLSELQRKQHHGKEIQFKKPHSSKEEKKISENNVFSDHHLEVDASNPDGSDFISLRWSPTVSDLRPEEYENYIDYYVVTTDPHDTSFWIKHDELKSMHALYSPSLSSSSTSHLKKSSSTTNNHNSSSSPTKNGSSSPSLQDSPTSNSLKRPTFGDGSRRELRIHLDDLSPGIDYSFRVRIVSKNGHKSPFSEPSNSVMTPRIPAVDYNVIQMEQNVVGTGAFGDIYSGEWEHRRVAIKTLRQRKQSVEMQKSFEKEVRVWSSINYPTLLPLLYQCSDKMLMVMPLCSGNLTEMVKREEISNFRKFYIAHQIASGMNYLHQNKILHRDLKGTNILITSINRVRISDFGLSKSKEITESSVNTKIVGTIAYMAPEVFNQTGFNYHADVYSFGMVLYELAAQKTPFHGLTLPKVLEKLFDVKQRPKLPSKCPFGFAVLIQLCWLTEPNHRPTFAQVLEYMKYQEEQREPYESLPRQTTKSSRNTRAASIDEPDMLKIWDHVTLVY